MINLDKTKTLFNYEVNESSPVTKPVVANCDLCNHEKIYSSLEYYQRKIARHGKIKCQKCSHSHRKNNSYRNKSLVVTVVPLPPEVDIQATIEKFGYDPLELPDWSRKQIIIRCSVTQAIHYIKRCSLNRMKSVLETGHYVSVGGYTKQRRIGAKVSELTKKKMRKSQSLRRQKEKESNANQATLNKSDILIKMERLAGNS